MNVNLLILLASLTAAQIIYRQFFCCSLAPKSSNYQLFTNSPLFHLDYYPLNKTFHSQYQPVAEWSGCLILGEPFVKFQVQNAPGKYKHLIGKIVNLKWSQNSQVQEYVKQVTVDVNFTQKARKSQQQGFVHPERLDGRSSVDPLQSLAGARPVDDVCVKLIDPIVAINSQNQTELIIDSEPVQITGRFVGLVRIEAAYELTERREVNQAGLQKLKRPKSPWALGRVPVSEETREGQYFQKMLARKRSDRFIVRHYNKVTQSFDDGIEEVIRIPQVPEDRRGIPRSTHQDIEKSPLNSQGWYIYGAPDATGTFVVQAIEPRALFRLQPQQVITQPTEANAYLNQEIWANTTTQKGNINSVLLAPNAEAAISQWRLGDKALVIHVFGGIGGKKAESKLNFFVPGHFAYGIAEVVRDFFTDELRFEIVYYQVYAHNPDGIISGAQTWATYMGSLWQGWLGNRPTCDILVKFPAITTDYDFAGLKLSPLKVFTREITQIMARYRVGDGTGASIVTPATSSVQDSNQALYLTIRHLEKLVESNPASGYVQHHPESLQIQYFKALVSLGHALKKELIPQDGESVLYLSGIGDNNSSFTDIFPWRVLPKMAQDEIAKIFLQQGATQWVLRTNQVGGYDSNIVPVAPIRFG